MSRMVSVTARPKKSSKPKHKVRHMTITPADNGYMAETHLHPSGEGDKMEYPQPETKVFSGKKAHQELGNHVASTFAPPGGAGEETGESAATEDSENEAAE